MFFSDHGGVQWLVVFLGNPGLKYQNTRHNAGFLTADVVEKDCGVHIDRLRFHALTAQAELGGQKVAAHEAADVYEQLRRGRGAGGEVL